MNRDNANAWLQRRSADWHELETELGDLEDKQFVTYKQLRRYLHAYPELARDVSMARRSLPNSRTATYVNLLYQRLHRALFSVSERPLGGLKIALREDIPEIVASLRWHIFSVSLGFLLSAVAGWWLIATFPQLTSLVASEDMIRTVESGKLWTDSLLNVIPSSLLSLDILTNNIVVALTTMMLGILYGLGTIYIIGLNGLMIGGVFAFTAQHGMADRLFNFVIAHGCVELSVIAVAGAIGFYIGESIARPGEQTRTEAFSRAVQRGTKLMALCVAFLVGAGIIEGYISPNAAFPTSTRIAIGLAYWALFLVACNGWRLRRGNSNC